MGYHPDFEEDVFISYAHNDDDIFAPEQSGWVSQLHQNLEQRVRNYLGADVRLWRDCDIRNNEDFARKIMNRLIRTATFLSVLSPSFLHREWCKRELESFANHAENHIGILVDDERSRIFKVEKMPVARDELPTVMQGTKTYRFFQPDPAHPTRTVELRPLFGGEYYRRYWQEMDGLASDIAELLKGMTKSAGSSVNNIRRERPVVYVAETTLDIDNRLSELRRDLKDRGYVVLPNGDLPYRASGFKEQVRRSLEQAVLSIHLVGASYGFTPEGETKSGVWLQHDLAMERGLDPNFLRLIWLPRCNPATDPRQREFINYLQTDNAVQKGGDLLGGSIEEFKTVLYQHLGEMRERLNGSSRRTAATRTANYAVGEPPYVYIICNGADQKSPSLMAMKKYFLSKGCEPVLPAQSGNENEELQVHVENLSRCDACLIFYGHGSSAWFESKLRDLRKYLRGRQPPVAAKAIYIAEPHTEQKDEVETLEAIVLRKTGEFSPETIEPFVQRLLAAAQGA
jgi:hypothetical protein